MLVLFCEDDSLHLVPETTYVRCLTYAMRLVTLAAILESHF